MKTTPLTEKQVQDLAKRLRDAYLEECESGECRCITIEEHARNLVTKVRQKSRSEPS